MKVVLINSMWNAKENLMAPLGLLNLATVLDHHGYQVQMIDFNHLYKTGELEKSKDSGENFKLMVDYILNQEPDLVGFHSVCNSYQTNLTLSQQIKLLHPELPVIFGGPQASVTAVSSMEAFPWIDLIAIGETEKTIDQIIKGIQGEIDLATIPGIAYRDGEAIKVNRDVALNEDLDTLPMIDYSFYPSFNDLRTVHIEAGRGCPYGCTYCSTKTFWKRKFRLKSPQRIIDEIKSIYHKYNKQTFSFVHDLFTFDRAKVLEFCSLVSKLDFPIRWVCSARADTLDEELIRTMQKAGCTGIFLGIETGSPRMQKLIRKNLDLADAWEKIKLLQQYQIQTKISFIYGFPQENYDDIRQTLEMITRAKRLGVEVVQLYLFSFLVGTELFDEYQDTLTFNPYFSEFIGDVNRETCTEMIREYPKIFPQFYNLETELRTNLKNLDIFVSAYYVSLFNDLSCTYAYLLEYYNNDLLAFFLDFRKYIPDFAVDATYDNDYLYSSNTQLDIAALNIQRIQKFVDQMDFAEDTTKIREMCAFESAIFDFMHIQTEQPEAVFTYHYDLFAAKQERLNLSNTLAKPIQIKFERYESDRLKILKTDLEETA